MAQRGHGGFGESGPVEILRDGRDLSGGYAIDDHLHHGERQSLRIALIAHEGLGAEVPVPQTRNCEGKGAQTGLHGAITVTVARGGSVFRAFAEVGSDMLHRLVFQDLVQNALHKLCVRFVLTLNREQVVQKNGIQCNTQLSL